MPKAMRYRDLRAALLAEAELPAKGMVAVTTTYNVRARHWANGWELHIDGIGVTQVRTLERAEQQVRDYLETLLDIDPSNATVNIRPDLGGLEHLVRTAQEHSRAAEAAQRKAAQEVRRQVDPQPHRVVPVRTSRANPSRPATHTRHGGVTTPVHDTTREWTRSFVIPAL